ncbi:MAG: hypothetical protein ACE5FU_07315 [Nitrospinota bacterium]
MKKYLLLFFLWFGLSVPAGAYQEVVVSKGGSVSGTLFFKGTPPAPIKRPVKKHPEECGMGERSFQEVVVQNGRLSNAVVYLSDIKKGKPFIVPPEGFSIKQEKCFFTPHLQAVKQKSILNVLSKDAVGHNIHAYEVDGDRLRTIFNVAQPFADMVLKEKVRVRRSQYVKVECDIHDFMMAWIFVAKNPYFAIVKEDGTFELQNIPEGEYTLKAWNPLLGEIKQGVQVSPGGKVRINFSFSEKSGSSS